MPRPAPEASGSEQSDDGPHSLTDIIDRVRDQTSEQESVSFDDVLSAFDDRLFGPIVIVPALILVSPLGALPGAPAIVGLVLISIVSQRVMGRRQPWLPDAIRTKSVSRSRMDDALESIRPWAGRVDAILKPRLTVLVAGRVQHSVLLVLLLVLSILTPILGFIPFLVFVPGAAIVAFGLAMTARDGAVALAGYILTAVALTGFLWWVL